MLNVSSLNFSYGDKRLFENLSFEVSAGEHIVIVGDSGGGKSTLLNLIADCTNPAIMLRDGCNSTMLLQEGALLEHLNVIDNLKLVARYSNQPVGKNRINELFEQLNINTGLSSARPSQLSGGQMRRISIARALLTNPDLILFDEPDAGLDLVNLTSLANTINTLTTQQNKACITISHNPFFIAKIANRVLRVQEGQLVEIANWRTLPDDEETFRQRQFFIQQALSRVHDPYVGKVNAIKPDWPLMACLQGVVHTIRSLFHLPRSPRDELYIAAYGSYLSFISGVLFFALVGLMLGATTIAVVRLLADRSLTGLISFFIKPEALIDLMGGIYALYLAPAIGGMLFAARSGSIMSNWLGEIVRTKQFRALKLLGVPTDQYIRAPSLFAMFISGLAAISWFTLCVWCGGVLATIYLFDIANATTVMSLSHFDLQRSLFWPKVLVYSALISLIVVGLGLAAKVSSHQLNIHTTKTIIYSTLSIAFAEMLIILT